MTNKGTIPAQLHPEVEVALSQLDLDPSRPLIISDADEVLLQFMAGFERYLDGRGLWIDLQSFALSGNIKEKDSNTPFPVEDTKDLLSDFFIAETHKLEAVEHAADALKSLSARAQIIVLTNVPFEQRDTRAQSLARQGMDYPVIANTGLKGGAVKYLGDRVKAPVFFLDDIPHNLKSVAEAHEPSKRLHFIADRRLAKLLPPSKHSHFHSSHWPDAQQFIEQELAAAGY
ncbi:MAG: hypothetical protein JJ939_07885 [Alphaproteobacteria bacterium]|nr:hypothetical protein [Alphaproteobacteria bacterium]MBO6628327.1 hypothetical protein [Alphaproteobacteria bacterium]MDF1624713.1 hypothetical protein [Parvibaculaceae bacterium]